MGPKALRELERQQRHFASLSTADQARLTELRARHDELGARRAALHAAVFAAKRRLADAEAAYRAVIGERLAVQAELAPLLPPSHR